MISRCIDSQPLKFFIFTIYVTLVLNQIKYLQYALVQRIFELIPHKLQFQEVVSHSTVDE